MNQTNFPGRKQIRREEAAARAAAYERKPLLDKVAGQGPKVLDKLRCVYGNEAVDRALAQLSR